MSEYVVIYERGEDGGWGAYLPDLPGCVNVGGSFEEVERGIREAVELHVGYMREEGIPIPPATSVAGTVSIATG